MSWSGEMPCFPQVAAIRRSARCAFSSAREAVPNLTHVPPHIQWSTAAKVQTQPSSTVNTRTPSVTGRRGDDRPVRRGSRPGSEPCVHRGTATGRGRREWPPRAAQPRADLVGPGARPAPGATPAPAERRASIASRQREASLRGAGSLPQQLVIHRQLPDVPATSSATAAGSPACSFNPTSRPAKARSFHSSRR